MTFEYAELKSRVLAHFGVPSLRALVPTAVMRIKFVTLAVLFFAVYGNLLRQPDPSYGLVFVSGAALVFLASGLMLNSLHDLIHGTLFRRRWLRTSASYLSDLLGASHLIWHNRHNRCHHYHTNDADRDEDLQTGGILRFSTLHPKYGFHRYQAWYAPIGYFLYGVMWFYGADLEKFLRGRTMEVKLKGFTPLHAVLFWVFKFLHVFVFVYLPYKTWGMGGVFGYFVVASLVGMSVASVNNIAHVFTGAHYHSTAAFSSRDAFVLSQIRTTACFSPENRFTSFMMGGVNHQLVHHLFPDVPHAYHPDIYVILKRYAEECGVRLHSSPSLFAAVRGHYAELARLGR